MTHSNAQQQLKQLVKAIEPIHFADNMTAQRNRAYRAQTDALSLFYTRNPLNEQIINALIAYAHEQQLSEAIEALFAGACVNKSEGRSAKHHLLRAPLNKADTDSVKVHEQLLKIKTLADKLATQNWPHPVHDIICLGVGGSELGTRSVYEALTLGRAKKIRLHFVANIDPIALSEALTCVNLTHTLFVVTSKTFTTFEVVKNLDLLKRTFLNTGFSLADFYARAFAVTAKPEAALAAGFSKAHTFCFWDWVGGRYSLWSAVSLPLALALGFETFQALLDGAHQMDQHFLHTVFKDNLPVMLALIHTWYSQFLRYPTRAVIPYAENLKAFVEHLQQLEMESLGKNLSANDKPVDHPTCPVVWGDVGSNAQHAFFQLLHQGTQIVPVDFIATSLPADDLVLPKDLAHEAHAALLANCLSQSEALMQGGKSLLQNPQAKHTFLGNRPSNLLLMPQLTPYALGQLIAAYEHKVYVQSVLWQINAFDQKGVELGKQICASILNQPIDLFDLSTITERFDR